MWNTQKENDLEEEFQSAYRQKHSTETVLLKVHNDLMCAVDEGKADVIDMSFLPSLQHVILSTILFCCID